MKFALKLPKLPVKSQTVAAIDPDAEEEEGTFLTRLLDRKRMLRVAALFIVAGAAGQVMQVMQAKNALLRQAAAEAQAQAKPVEIVALSGEAAAQPATGTLSAGLVSLDGPVLADPVLDDDAPVMLAAAESAAMVYTAPELPQPEVILAAATPEQPAAALETAPVANAAPTDCPVTLDLAVVPGAMIGVTLLAPCAPNARVVLQHQGLAVTGMTTASGALFASLPAMTAQAMVAAVMADGTKVETTLAVPEAVDFRRFGVQWQGDDAFQVNAYENGAAYGTPGHINGVQPGVASDTGGFLQILGDPSAPMPLLAEVYTYPKATGPVEMTVEAAVTDKTCGREILGETLLAVAGKVVVTDLTLAMPDCSAIGDFLVLNNLAGETTLAAN